MENCSRSVFSTYVPIATDTNHVALSKYSQNENQHGNVSKVGELVIFELGNFLGSITIIARSKGKISDMSLMWQIKKTCRHVASL